MIIPNRWENKKGSKPPTSKLPFVKFNPQLSSQAALSVLQEISFDQGGVDVDRWCFSREPKQPLAMRRDHPTAIGIGWHWTSCQDCKINQVCITHPFYPWVNRIETALDCHSALCLGGNLVKTGDPQQAAPKSSPAHAATLAVMR